MIVIYNNINQNKKEINKKKVNRNNRNYNTLNNKHINIDNHQEVAVSLHPEWIVGFTDAEGSFHLSGLKNGPIKPKFSICLNIRDINILNQLQAYFNNMGSISRVKSNNAAIWTVSGNNDIKTLITFFNKHKLRTKKLREFLLWKRAWKCSLHDSKRLIYQKLIRELRSREFPTRTPLSIEWLLGFIEGEGCFLV